MCKNVCARFTRQQGETNYYCQNCARYIPLKNTHLEDKKVGRKRCSCCNGLVRNKPKVFYSTNKLTTT